MASRRSPPHHSPIHTSEEGAGAARRRIPRRHPQIETCEEDGAGVTCRGSPSRLSRIRANEEDGAGVTCRRSRGISPSPAAPAPLPVDDDMLREILLRLPPEPSSLPRASAVCTHWRGLVTDPRFLRRFRAHHRKPPLLGFFQQMHLKILFTPILDPPDRIPRHRFSLGRNSSRDEYNLLDCRHGLVLIGARSGLVVHDPITGEQRRVAEPPDFKCNRFYFRGAVLCAARDQGHMHGGCHSSPFKVVLMSMCRRPTVCVYSSETGIWGNHISTEPPYESVGLAGRPATLVGNSLYWLPDGDGIFEFDLDGQSIAVITGPPITDDIVRRNNWIIFDNDGALGSAILSFPHLQMWRRNVNSQGVATWVVWKTIEMHTILGLPSEVDGRKWLMGHVDNIDVVFLVVGNSVYIVQLKSMQSRKLYETEHLPEFHPEFHPFTSFYTPGTNINGESNGAEMLHDT